VLKHAAAKAVLIGPALRPAVGVVAELASASHIVGVVLGGSDQGRVHPVRKEPDALADGVIPLEHAKQRRVAMKRTRLGGDLALRGLRAVARGLLSGVVSQGDRRAKNR